MCSVETKLSITSYYTTEAVRARTAADRQTQTNECYSTQIITGHIFANYCTIIGKKVKPSRFAQHAGVEG